MELGKYIDHTNLEVGASMKDIEKLCNEAMKYHFESVCVHPYYVPLVSSLLKGSNIGICCVVGFPFGMNTTSTKEYEAIEAVNNGATEIDMMINVAALKNKDYEYIKEEIEQVRDSIDGKILKVTIETCSLEKEEIIRLTEICNETFVNYIKISIGTGKNKLKIEDINLIKEHKNDVLNIEVSGEINTLTDIETMICAGATRIGTSHGGEIMKEDNHG